MASNDHTSASGPPVAIVELRLRRQARKEQDARNAELRARDEKNMRDHPRDAFPLHCAL